MRSYLWMLTQTLAIWAVLYASVWIVGFWSTIGVAVAIVLLAWLPLTISQYRRRRNTKPASVYTKGGE